MRRGALRQPFFGAASVAAFALLWAGAGAASETIERALAHAYNNNPTLNAQRAATPPTDEKVPQALSGYRPQVFGNADVADTWSRSTFTTPGLPPSETHLNPRGYGLTTRQTLFNGFQTGNLTRSAESQVLAARETLRNTEQNVRLRR